MDGEVEEGGWVGGRGAEEVGERGVSYQVEESGEKGGSDRDDEGERRIRTSRSKFEEYETYFLGP